MRLKHITASLGILLCMSFITGCMVKNNVGWDGENIDQEIAEVLNNITTGNTDDLKELLEEINLGSIKEMQGMTNENIEELQEIFDEIAMDMEKEDMQRGLNIDLSFETFKKFITEFSSSLKASLGFDN
ncbi:MAG: hypothetical protein ATN31_10950 [Candidatus Epulonipiscioides saccharophilum]|nr:MAG: hypothetical protein ATN31_10950 [Epulopiscium sp. AS2M-Bin001]